MHIHSMGAGFTWEDILEQLAYKLVNAPLTRVGEWQSIKGDHPMSITRELQYVSIEADIPRTVHYLQGMVKPNLPWAEDHFQERVSGVPHNPPPSHEWWPFAQSDNDEHRPDGEKFSHTYPERMWPKHAGHSPALCAYPAYFGNPDNELPGVAGQGHQCDHGPRRGIRFKYGDLNDLVELLQESLQTRQAYLPIWFPEDGQAALSEERVPCTLGYHFMVRDGKLNIAYYMRSCDFLRHFADDVYMAARLCQWVVEGLYNIEVVPGNLIMHISSLHIFEGDLPIMEMKYGPS